MKMSREERRRILGCSIVVVIVLMAVSPVFFAKARVRVEGRPEEDLKYHYQALNLARESDDKWHQVSLLTLTAEIEGPYKTDAGHFERARELLGEARSICDSIVDPSGALSILLNL
jgi:hypothetical protein